MHALCTCDFFVTFSFRIIPMVVVSSYRFGEILKAFTLRMAACKSYLKPLPRNCTCALQIITDSATQLALLETRKETFPWVEVDDREGRAIRGGQVQPIRGATADICPLEMFVEEAANKFPANFKSTKKM